MTTDSWLETDFGSLVENLDSKRVPVKRSSRKPGPYPYYGASGIVDYVDDYLFDGEYLLIAEDGENLNSRKTPVAFVARGKFWVNNHAHVLRGLHPSDTRFLAYCIESSDISGYVTGSAQPKLSQGNLHAIRLFVPPVRQRAAIARVLSALDEKIEQNRRTSSTLETTCQALFKSWFVDFDPIVAKAEGRRPPCVSDAVARLFPDSFHETDVGPIPSGWATRSLDQLLQLSRASISPAAYPNEQFLHFSIPAFDERRAPLPELGASIKSNKFLVPDHAILLSKLNPQIPRVWLSDLTPKRRAIASTEFLVILPRHEHDRQFLYQLFRSASFADDFASLVTGTSNSHQRVTPGDFLAIRTTWPSQQLRRVFAQVTEPLISYVASNLRQSATLASLRDALLPPLLSGELRIRHAEKLVEEVL